MQDIDWEMVKMNLDKLTDESLCEIRDMVAGILLDRAIEERLGRDKGK